MCGDTHTHARALFVDVGGLSVRAEVLANVVFVSTYHLGDRTTERKYSVRFRVIFWTDEKLSCGRGATPWCVDVDASHILDNTGHNILLCR